jgi:putative methyltransferase
VLIPSAYLSKGFGIDEHIPDLLAFNPALQFRDDPSYKTGKIILQDKASCFSAFVLSPPCNDPNAVVIDATAAPGNKTSHLSALMGNKGKVIYLPRFQFKPFDGAVVICF